METVPSDLYAQQVSLLLGEMLHIPAINGVSKILSLVDNTLTVERALEDEIETLSIPLPAAIAVSTDINSPQIPSMKAILGAAKKTGSGLDDSRYWFYPRGSELRATDRCAGTT